MERIIEVLNYDPGWKADFQTEKALLNYLLKGCECRIHHIGSTSVPGLAAKPIIDILLECSAVDVLDSYNAAFEEAGYTPKGEYGIAGRRYFRKGGVQHSHHVHAFAFGDDNIKRHLAFRDYLRDHPNIAQAYQQVKLDGVAQCNNDVQRYIDYKNDFIKHTEQEALAWYSGRVRSELA